MDSKMGWHHNGASPFLHHPSHISMGPRPMQLVVVMAVRKAVSAATTTFTAISIIRFFIIVHYQLSIINCEA
ncbi:MAG: hypothetical protein J6S56_03170 [Bacteroidales bacterium]|nr:hypothetical protein [Bacteroidales bacterium]